MQSKRLRRTLPAALLAGTVLLSGCSYLPFPVGKATESADAATLGRVADATRAAGDPISAIAVYRRAHDIDPGNVHVLLGLGDTLSELGDNDNAVEVYSLALETHPNDVDALRGMGNALIAMNKPELALSKLRHAVDIEANPSTQNSLAVAYDMLGHPDEAQATYRKGLELEPGHRVLGNNLGLSLALSGKHDEAVSVLGTLVDLSSASPLYRQNLALAYGLAGDLEMAARIGRMDLDEDAVAQNLTYYRVLNAIDNHAEKVSAVGVKSRGAREPLALASRVMPNQGRY